LFYDAEDGLVPYVGAPQLVNL